MPRRIDVTVPPEKTDTLIARVQEVAGVTGVQVQRGASLSPPGDVVVIQSTNDAQRALLRVFHETRVEDGGSISTTKLTSHVSSPHARALGEEGSELTWEETGFFLRKEVNPTPNYFALMALCGGIAAVGLWLDLLHIVIGAMVIAPGFEPLLRIPFGIIAGPREHLKDGVLGTLGGYALLALAAALTLPLLALVDPATPLDLHARAWVRFWSTITPTSVILAIVAGLAGIVTVSADRPVLTAGVMIALALIPAMTIVGLAVATLDVQLALAALGRWTVDALAVVLTSAAVMLLKQRMAHQQRALG